MGAFLWENPDQDTNATAFSSCPVVSALGSESDDPGSSPGRARRRALKTCGKKIASSAFRLNLYIILTGKIVGNRSTNSAINTK